jgi:hypothetical protein
MDALSIYAKFNNVCVRLASQVNGNFGGRVMDLDRARAARGVGELMQALDGALPSAADLPQPSLLHHIWTLPIGCTTTDLLPGACEWRSSAFASSGFASLTVLVTYRAGEESA